MRASLKVLTVGAAFLLALIVEFGVWLFGPDRVDVGRYKLESGVEVHLFIEADWEVGDLLYHTVQRDGREVVRKTYLSNHDRKDTFRTYTAASADMSVVGLWAETADVFILYHIPSGESWPRLRDDEVSYTPEVRQKWHSRYLLLRASSHALPVPSYFQEAANEQR